MFRDTKAFSSFSVNNIENAKKFYSSLGIKVSEENEMLWLHIGNSKIMIYPKENHVPATFTILNFPVTKLEQAMDDLKNLGVKFEHYDLPNLKTDENGIMEFPGVRIAWFKDPAGNVLSVLEE